jgi:hypothetical protein
MKPNNRTSGFTIIELLAIMAILGVAANFLLSPVYRAHALAKDEIWRMEAGDVTQDIRKHLSRYYQSQTNYPLLSPVGLYQRGVFDDCIMDFLQCPHVQYVPFSINDADDKIILRIDYQGDTNDLILTKGQVIKSK